MTRIGEPKNLIFIYAEGLERTYFNEDIFPGLTDKLRQLESESISFTNIQQEGYAHYTIGGIVASQCGIPLVAPIHGNQMTNLDTYLGQALCLGDLLNKAGYYLTYYGGADLGFQGKGKFFLTHKFDEVYGKQELLQKLNDQDYASGWGLYDDTLFDIVYNRFIELSKTKNKFAMFMLTLDTHHPDGLPSKSCEGIIYDKGKIPILNAVACSDYLISEFIKRIRQSEYSNKTVIVLVSDHLAMINSEVFKNAERTNLFIINTPDMREGIKINKWASTLDICSTIMPFIGYEGDVGFGRDIINRKESDEEIKNIHKNLSKWEPYIMQFWNFPKIKKSVEVDTANKKIYIDERQFKIPLFIELNDDLETILKFDCDLSVELGKNSRVLKTNQSFILIEQCKNTNHFVNKTTNYEGFCLLAGKGSKFLTHMMLPTSSTFTAEEIRKMTGLDNNDKKEIDQ
ncbi:MAG: sulfatase-like hydrolase/transferase [Candidatus Woesearchaeota archaeon]